MLRKAGARLQIIFSLLVAAAGCSADYFAQYDESIAVGDYEVSKALMQQHIRELSLRDLNPTLPLRMAQAYYRMAYAHGMLGEYDSMKTDLNSAVGHDPGLANRRQKMLEHFEVAEYNKAATAYNAGQYDGALERLRVALSIVEDETAHQKCAGAILCAMASTSIAAGSLEDALENYRRASALEDPTAAEMLALLEAGKTPDPLRELGKRRAPSQVPF